MGVLRVIFKLNLKKLFDFQNSPTKSIAHVLIVLIALAFGIFFGILINVSKKNGININEDQILNSMFIGVITITFLRGFFPSYKPIKSITKAIHPIGNLQRFTIDFLNELLTTYFITSIIFLLSFSISLTEKKLYYLVIMFLGLFSAHLARRIVHTIIDYKIKTIGNKWLIFSIGILLIITNLYYEQFISLANIILGFILLIIINIQFESLFKELKFYDKHILNFNLFNLKFFKLFFRNKLFRNIFLFDFISKVIFLYIDWQTYKNNGYHIAKFDFVIVFVLSPISLFAYCFNNFFGFGKSLWFTLQKSHADFFDTTGLLSKVLLFPLIIDMSLNFTYYYLSEGIRLFSIQYYFSSLIVLFGFAVFFSLQNPKQVNKAIGKGANVSPIANIISIAVVGFFMYLTQYFKNFSLLIAIVISCLVLIISKRGFKNSKYEIFEVLYKT